MPGQSGSHRDKHSVARLLSIWHQKKPNMVSHMLHANECNGFPILGFLVVWLKSVCLSKLGPTKKLVLDWKRSRGYKDWSRRHWTDGIKKEMNESNTIGSNNSSSTSSNSCDLVAITIAISLERYTNTVVYTKSEYFYKLSEMYVHLQVKKLQVLDREFGLMGFFLFWSTLAIVTKDHWSVCGSTV